MRFWEKHGIQANRKNVCSDIQLLMDFGVDIICVRSMQNQKRILEQYSIDHRAPNIAFHVDVKWSSHARQTVEIHCTDIGVDGNLNISQSA